MLWNEKCIQHLILLLDLPLRNPFRAMLMLSLEHTTPHFISDLMNWCLKGCTNFFREWQVRETPSNLSPEQSKSANDSLFNRVTSAVNFYEEVFEGQSAGCQSSEIPDGGHYIGC